MRRLLAPDGFLVVVDWERGRDPALGPPDELRYSRQHAVAQLQASGFDVERVDAPLPHHFALRARATRQD